MLGVDFDPETLHAPRATTAKLVYGDAEDEEFVAHLPLLTTRCIVSRLRDPPLNRCLIRALRRLGYTRHIVVTARTRQDHAGLLAAGADDVLTPYADAADHAARRIAAHLQPRSDTVTAPQEA